MALATFVEDITTLDESIQSYYVETEGGYILDVEPVNGFAIENVDSLKSALTKERKAAKDYERQIKSLQSKYDGLDDPEEIRAMREKYEELVQFDPEKEADKIAEQKFESSKKRLEAALNKAWESKWQTEHEPVASKYQAVTKQLEKELVHSAAIKALVVEKGDADLLLPHVLNKIKLTQKEDGTFEPFVVDDTGEVAYNSKAEPMSIQELVSTFKTKFPSAFESSARPGGGALPGKGKGDKPVEISFGEALKNLKPGESLL